MLKCQEIYNTMEGSSCLLSPSTASSLKGKTFRSSTYILSTYFTHSSFNQRVARYLVQCGTSPVEEKTRKASLTLLHIYVSSPLFLMHCMEKIWNCSGHFFSVRHFRQMQRVRVGNYVLEQLGNAVFNNCGFGHL